MIERKSYLDRVLQGLSRSPIVALLGPRQCGKTTLSRMLGERRVCHYFDLESQADLRRLENPELLLGSLDGVVIIDEIQRQPELFAVLRVLADKPSIKSRFLILGSASPELIRKASDTLAGRVEFVDMAGFDISELGGSDLQRLWIRGGFPRSYLAASERDSAAWREGFIRTFLQRDIPQLGITVASATLRKFWTMVAHYHGRVWNASGFASAMGINDKTARSYLDILTETYMIRTLPPWHENIRKRQVKSPKVYFRDTGLLHSLLDLEDFHAVSGHPHTGASWEGFAMEQILLTVRPSQAYFWATHGGAELDLFFIRNGRRYGFEMKYSEAPERTKSMRIAMETLHLDQMFVVYPGEEIWSVEKNITVCPLYSISEAIEKGLS